MPLLNILVGAVVLLFGRRLFWLFVAAAGFLVGMMLATDWFEAQPDWVVLVIALGFGIVAAILSVFLQKLVIAFAGFMAAGYVLYTLAGGLGYESLAWIAFLVGGILGAVLVLILFDWALIGLSSLLGATVIVENAPLDQVLSAVLFVVLLVVGIIVQARQLVKKGAPPPPKERTT